MFAATASWVASRPGGQDFVYTAPEISTGSPEEDERQKQLRAAAWRDAQRAHALQKHTAKLVMVNEKHMQAQRAKADSERQVLIKRKQAEREAKEAAERRAEEERQAQLRAAREQARRQREHEDITAVDSFELEEMSQEMDDGGFGGFLSE